MSGMLIPAAATISSSASANGAPSARASRRPIEVLPAPIRPDQHDAARQPAGRRRLSGGSWAGAWVRGIGLDVELRGRRRYKAGLVRSEATVSLRPVPPWPAAIRAAPAPLEDPALLRLLLLGPAARPRRRRRVPRHLGHPGPDPPGRDRRARRAPATLDRAAIAAPALALAPVLLAVPAAGPGAAARAVPGRAAARPGPHRAGPHAPIGVQDLPAPAPDRGPGRGGGRARRAALGARARRPTSPSCCSRLPAAIDEPTPARAAARPARGAGPCRARRPTLLLALASTACWRWARPTTALELLAQAPPGRVGGARVRCACGAGSRPGQAALGLRAWRVQADRRARPGPRPRWSARRSRATPPRSSSGSTGWRLSDDPADPSLAGLARAAAAGDPLHAAAACAGRRAAAAAAAHGAARPRSGRPSPACRCRLARRWPTIRASPRPRARRPVAPARPGPSVRPELTGDAPGRLGSGDGGGARGTARPLGGAGRRAGPGDPGAGLERTGRTCPPSPDRRRTARSGAASRSPGSQEQRGAIAPLRPPPARRPAGGRGTGDPAPGARRPGRAGPGARCPGARGRHRRGLGPVTPCSTRSWR